MSNLIINTYTAEICGGGYKKVPLTKFKRLEDKCSPLINEGWCQAR